MLVLAAGMAWGSSVEVSPPVVELVAKPGAAVSGEFRVRNPGGRPVSISVEVGDLGHEDGATLLRPAGTLDRGAGAWTFATPPSLTLAAGAKETISVRANVPEAATGGAYAFVRVRTVKGNGKGMHTGAGVVVLVPIRVTGTEVLSLQYDGVSLRTDRDRQVFAVAVQNNGNSHLRATFRGVVQDASGAVLSRIESSQRGYYPGKAAELLVEIDPTLLDEKLRVVGAIEAPGVEPIPVAWESTPSEEAPILAPLSLPPPKPVEPVVVPAESLSKKELRARKRAERKKRRASR